MQALDPALLAVLRAGEASDQRAAAGATDALARVQALRRREAKRRARAAKRDDTLLKARAVPGGAVAVRLPAAGAPVVSLADRDSWGHTSGARLWASAPVARGVKRVAATATVAPRRVRGKPALNFA
jgi:hypothetical protein